MARKRGNPNWTKGKSGNPKGRLPVKKEIRDLAREQSEKAINKIAGLMDSNDEKIALAASREILDRGIGKPTATVEHKGEVGIGARLTRALERLDE